MLKYLLITLFFFAGLSLFAADNTRSINASLTSLESNETLADDPIIEKTLNHYKGTISVLYKRHQATRVALAPIEAKFEKAGIPPYFSLVPYAESKFNASSRGCGSAGLWQFGKQTACNFGLIVKKKKDERLNASRSTDAAIRYIKYLKREFGSWYLADFAYAMGEGKLKKIIKKNSSDEISVLLKDPEFPKGTKAHFAKTVLLDARINYYKADEVEEEVVVKDEEQIKDEKAE
ncbi:lytic transglycosylase domain-containing protein [Sulfurimonas sp.]|uniref:lytic transglycosylase domain-containing protein n=1 Tax=Sulfurimonas sp. TaxID=2022749 RepID=UPI0025FAEAA0|nr:lytic transglycosylase domain-containing protein [Sulfurimonas sp.]